MGTPSWVRMCQDRFPDKSGSCYSDIKNHNAFAFSRLFRQILVLFNPEIQQLKNLNYALQIAVNIQTSENTHIYPIDNLIFDFWF